jgi:hypothetical protein
LYSRFQSTINNFQWKPNSTVRSLLR